MIHRRGQAFGVKKGRTIKIQHQSRKAQGDDSPPARTVDNRPDAGLLVHDIIEIMQQ